MIRRIAVLGEPRGKERPRASFYGGHAHIYTPKKTLSYEGRFASAWWEAYPDTAPSAKAIKISVTAVLALRQADYNSKGLPNKHGCAKLDGTELPTKKPDCDNILKAVLDGLNKVAFVDDSQVVEIAMKKTYGLTPKVEVTVEELY